MANRISISPKMIEWAIKRSGKDVRDYTIQYPKVGQWLQGDVNPTYKQAEEFASKLSVPFGYLFLSEPPKEEVPIPFFRGEAKDKFDLNTYDTVMLLQGRQEWLSGYLNESGCDTLEFIGSVNPSDSVEKVCSVVRSLLDLPEDWAFNFSRQDEALSHVGQKLTGLGIVVSFNGVVANNSKRKISVSSCRGFSLVDEYAPFIFVNNSDSKTAQLFTLIHEFVHLLLGFSSGFGGSDAEAYSDKVEAFCDKVAANFLVPTGTLKENWNGIERTADKFKVSPIMMARRAKEVRLIGSKDYKAFCKEYYNREIHQKRASSGGDYYSTSKKRLSWLFLVHIDNAVRSNKLMLLDAYRLTGLFGSTYNSVVAKI